MRAAVDWRSRSLQGAQSLLSLSCVVFVHKFLVLGAEIVVVDDAFITLLCQGSAPFDICFGPPYLSTCPLLVDHALPGVSDSILVFYCLRVPLERFQKIVHYSNRRGSRSYNTATAYYWQLDKLVQQEPAARDLKAIRGEATFGKLVGILITMLVTEIPILI